MNIDFVIRITKLKTIQIIFVHIEKRTSKTYLLQNSNHSLLNVQKHKYGTMHCRNT